MKNETQKSYTILVAEDDQFISKAFKTGLEKGGFKVEIALDGAEALDKAKNLKPDLILLDIIMPVKNGFDVLEGMSKDPDLKKIPVIVSSNLGQESDIDRATKLGAVGYFVKSNTSMKSLVAKVQDFFSKKS